ncbi:MAG: hypothetical protein ACFNLE_07075, partial [Rothia aeria]
MKLMVDARYTRIGFHDGISRYTASLLGTLKGLMDSGTPEVADMQLVMVISDERQLQMLPGLPHVKICSPTGPLEPTAALQLLLPFILGQFARRWGSVAEFAAKKATK